MPSEEDRATATGNKQIRFGEVRMYGFRDIRIVRQTAHHNGLLGTLSGAVYSKPTAVQMPKRPRTLN